MQQRPTFLQTVMLVAPATTITIGINLVVFLLWQLARGSEHLAVFMGQNFLVSWTSVLEGRVWTLLTSAYSHIDLMHLVVNMFVLWSFGVGLERLWGRRTFYLVYLVSGVVGSLAHCMTSAWILGVPAQLALGASGAVCAVVMAAALHFPRMRILLFGIVPIPALVGVVAMVAFDVSGLISQTRGAGIGIGHAAHLGGGLAGGLLWLGYLRQRFARR